MSEPIGLEVVHPEDRAEDLLHIANMRADPDSRAGLALDEGCRAQMVGMGVGFEHALDRHAFLFGGGKDRFGRAHVRLARGEIEVEHRVDDCALRRVRIPDQIADRVGRFVEEGANAGVRHDESPSGLLLTLDIY